MFAGLGTAAATRTFCTRSSPSTAEVIAKAMALL